MCTDADYLAFVEKLEQAPTTVAPKSILNREAAAPVAPKKPVAKVTALVLEIQNRHANKGLSKPPKAATREWAVPDLEESNEAADRAERRRSKVIVKLVKLLLRFV